MSDEMRGCGPGFSDAHSGTMMGANVITGGGCGDGGEACCSMAKGTGAGVGGGLLRGYLVLAMRIVNRVEREW